MPLYTDAETYFAQNPEKHLWTCPEGNTFIHTPDKKLYRREKLLAQGSAGKVYEAFDTTGQRYAIKFSSNINNDLSKAQKEAKFLQELNLLSAHAFSYTENDMLTHVTPMNYLGSTLEDYLQTHPDLCLDQRYQLAIELCNIVATLHRQGIAHGDIKPSNIIIDEQNKLHLIDFECATRNMSSKESYDSTKMYMAPSSMQLTRQQADIVALMRTLYLDEQFLTASTLSPSYDRKEDDLYIFKLTDKKFSQDIQEKIKPLLSTSGQNDNGATLSAKQFIATLLSIFTLQAKLLVNSDPEKAIRNLTLKGLEFAKLHFPPQSYEFQYATKNHLTLDTENKNDAITALKQALRVMTHHSKLFKIKIANDNPFFNEAIKISQLNTDNLKETLYNKKPSGICTYATLYKQDQKKHIPELLKRLKDFGVSC